MITTGAVIGHLSEKPSSASWFTNVSLPVPERTNNTRLVSLDDISTQTGDHQTL
jgi:hypothetical protein